MGHSPCKGTESVAQSLEARETNSRLTPKPVVVYE
nr:MAG TPA: hypothetical protein [Caudoviricetes sp.]